MKVSIQILLESENSGVVLDNWINERITWFLQRSTLTLLSVVK